MENKANIKSVLVAVPYKNVSILAAHTHIDALETEELRNDTKLRINEALHDGEQIIECFKEVFGIDSKKFNIIESDAECQNFDSLYEIMSEPYFSNDKISYFMGYYLKRNGKVTSTLYMPSERNVRAFQSMKDFIIKKENFN